MTTSDAGWLKKFLGENPTSKALRDRLEEATALLTFKDEAIAALQHRLAEALAVADRETARATLLQQAEARANQTAKALSVERDKLVAANLLKQKAEVQVKGLLGQVQKLEKQGLELRANLSSMDQERTTSVEVIAGLNAELARIDQLRRAAVSQLAESRAQRETLSTTCKVNETKTLELGLQLEAISVQLRETQHELSRCRLASSELIGAALGTVYAALGQSCPIALRLALKSRELKTQTSVVPGPTVAQCLAEVERSLSDAGLAVSMTTSSEQTWVEFKRDDFDAVTESDLAFGYWIGSWVAFRLTEATNGHHELVEVDTTESGVRAAIRMAGDMGGAA